MRYYLFVWLALAGCGVDVETDNQIDDQPNQSNCDEPQQSSCSNRYGTYVVKYMKFNGDCPDIADQYIITQKQPQSPEEINEDCSGVIFTSKDNCNSHIHSLCATNSGFTLETGEQLWSFDGKKGIARLEISMYDEDRFFICTGVYTAIYEKLSINVVGI